MAKDPEDWPMEIAPGAFDSQVGRTVPIVVYKGGERIVVGEATLAKGVGSDLVASARIDSNHIGMLVPLEAKTSVTAQHAAAFGVAKATPDSIGAWARMVEQASKLDDESS
jgi:hypothetical protein